MICVILNGIFHFIKFIFLIYLRIEIFILEIREKDISPGDGRSLTLEIIE